MEPTLHNGDMIWLKRANIAEVGIRDILTLSSPEFGPISHRVIGMEPVSGERYLVETKGDANPLSEYWMVEASDTVYIMVGSIPFGGYVLDYLDNVYVRVMVVFLGITGLIAVYIRHGRTKVIGKGL